MEAIGGGVHLPLLGRGLGPGQAAGRSVHASATGRRRTPSAGSSAWTRCFSGGRITSRRKTRGCRGGTVDADSPVGAGCGAVPWPWVPSRARWVGPRAGIHGSAAQEVGGSDFLRAAARFVAAAPPRPPLGSARCRRCCQWFVPGSGSCWRSRCGRKTTGTTRGRMPRGWPGWCGGSGGGGTAFWWSSGYPTSPTSMCRCGTRAGVITPSSTGTAAPTGTSR